VGGQQPPIRVRLTLMRRRLGTFFLFASFICFFLVATDVSADNKINDFLPFLLGVAGLLVGMPLWLSRSGPPKEEGPPARFRTLRSLMGKPKKK
jgi:hypothetical protein